LAQPKVENLGWAKKTINDGPSGSGPVARSVLAQPKVENLGWAKKTINDGPSGSGPVARSVLGPA
jgi:hypothetical protein